MTSRDALIERIAEADPAPATAQTPRERSELADRVRRRVLQAAAVATNSASVSDPTPDDTGATGRPRQRGLTTILAFVASILVVAAVVAVFALIGGSRQPNSHTSGAGTPTRSDHAQAEKLYAPVAEFYRTTTPSERALPANSPAVKAVTRRVNACQAPYQKQMFEGFVSGSSREKLYLLYENGTLLQSYQTRVAPIAPQLTLLAQSLAGMRLSNPIMQRFAHALAAELYATLRAPKFDSCAFIDGIARHHFSLSWAQRSSYGRAATSFQAQISVAGNAAGEFWRWIYPTGKLIPRERILTKSQLRALANLPGEIS